MRNLSDTLREFGNDDDGAQVIEYALVIALISLVLALALSNAASDLPSSFVDLAGRVTDCLTLNSAAC